MRKHWRLRLLRKLRQEVCCRLVDVGQLLDHGVTLSNPPFRFRACRFQKLSEIFSEIRNINVGRLGICA